MIINSNTLYHVDMHETDRLTVFQVDGLHPVETSWLPSNSTSLQSCDNIVSIVKCRPQLICYMLWAMLSYVHNDFSQVH